MQAAVSLDAKTSLSVCPPIFTGDLVCPCAHARHSDARSPLTRTATPRSAYLIRLNYRKVVVVMFIGQLKTDFTDHCHRPLTICFMATTQLDRQEERTTLSVQSGWHRRLMSLSLRSPARRARIAASRRDRKRNAPPSPTRPSLLLVAALAHRLGRAAMRAIKSSAPGRCRR